MNDIEKKPNLFYAQLFGIIIFLGGAVSVIVDLYERGDSISQLRQIVAYGLIIGALVFIGWIVTQIMKSKSYTKVYPFKSDIAVNTTITHDMKNTKAPFLKGSVGIVSLIVGYALMIERYIKLDSISLSKKIVFAIFTLMFAYIMFNYFVKTIKPRISSILNE